MIADTQQRHEDEISRRQEQDEAAAALRLCHLQDGVSVYESYPGRWTWRMVRNGLPGSGTQTWRSRSEAVQAARTIARCSNLPFVA